MAPQEIKKLRQKFSWSQERLARELGMSYCIVNRWEKSKSHPSPRALRGLKRLEEQEATEELKRRPSFVFRQISPVEVRLKGFEMTDDSVARVSFIRTTS